MRRFYHGLRACPTSGVNPRFVNLLDMAALADTFLDDAARVLAGDR